MLIYNSTLVVRP